MATLYQRTVVVFAVAAMMVATAGMSWADDLNVNETYMTFKTAQRGELTMTLDSGKFRQQGWELSNGSVVAPVMLEGDHEIEILTVNDDLLRMSGSPQALALIELTGPEGESLTITGFEIPFTGRRDAALMDGQHPVLQVVGDSIEIILDAPDLQISGEIAFHAAAAEHGIDAEVGSIGTFVLTATVDLADVDASVEPVREVADSGPSAANAPGADVIVGSLPTVQNWTAGNAVGGFHAYSVATTSCNIGTQPLDWFQGPNRRHPVIAQNLYRYHEGRFEQIGQSWLKHGFCALQQSLCGACTPVGNCCCAQLGVGCSDPYSAPRNGTFGNMGPRSEINAHMGTNLGNHAFPSGATALRGRIVVRESDLDDANFPGALFYMEGHYVAEDDAQFGAMTNDNNNASYRRAIVNQNNFFIGLTGGTIREEPAINAWKVNDPSVELVNIDIPGDGRLIMGCDVTDNGDGTWHYEFAVHNLNSDRSVGTFTVPVPLGVTVTNMGFHSVDSHSGEPYSNAAWQNSEGDGAVSWNTESFAQNSNANAIRWGTLYNFRFDANSAPEVGNVNIGLFKPGTPNSMSAAALVPSAVGPILVHGGTDDSFASHSFGGYIDARAESTDGINIDLGMNEVTLVFSEEVFSPNGGDVDIADFTVTQTGPGQPPVVVSVNASNNPEIQLLLSRNITIREWTTILADVVNGDDTPILNLGNQGDGVDEPDRIDIGFLPGDVNQSGNVNPVDLFQFRQIINDIATLDRGVREDFADIDRNGVVNPQDLFRLRQLINGVTPPATQPWATVEMNSARP